IGGVGRLYCCLEIPMRYVIPFVMFCLCTSFALNSFADECPSNWKALHPAWIWCDDFETDKTTSYFEKTGPFNRTAGAGLNVWYGLNRHGRLDWRMQDRSSWHSG